MTAKKGVGFWNGDGSFDRMAGAVDDLDCAWYYNWTSWPDNRDREIRAGYIPMIWDGRMATEENFKRLREGGFQTLLAFNEPDKKDQSDMKVEEALRLWPRLMQTGMRLGSPAPAAISPSKNWLARFMQGAEALDYRVDFICLHWYGDITAPDAVEQLKEFLEGQYRLYGKPIWLTEFSGSNGKWLRLADPPVTLEKNAGFIGRALPMLESLPFLERYAWFELKWEKAPWAQVALVSSRSGKLTVAGRAYQRGGKKE